MTKQNYYAVVDCGGTRIKCGIVADGHLLQQCILPAGSDIGLAAALPRVVDALNHLADEVGVDLKKCRGIAFAVPALIDYQQQRIGSGYGKFLDAPHIDLPAWAAATWGIPLRLENDARLALLGEWTYGAGQGSADLAVVTLGTGIGTAILNDGVVLRGKRGIAGNLGGHSLARWDGELCLCGMRGCYEAETGSRTLDQRVRARSDFGTSDLQSLVLGEINYQNVFAAAAANDSCAQALCAYAIHLWGCLGVGLAQAYDLDRVVYGGGIMTSADVIVPGLRAAFVNYPIDFQVEVRAAADPNHMALYGAEPLFTTLYPG